MMSAIFIFSQDDALICSIHIICMTHRFVVFIWEVNIIFKIWLHWLCFSSFWGVFEFQTPFFNSDYTGYVSYHFEACLNFSSVLIRISVLFCVYAYLSWTTEHIFMIMDNGKLVTSCGTSKVLSKIERT